MTGECLSWTPPRTPPTGSGVIFISRDVPDKTLPVWMLMVFLVGHLEQTPGCVFGPLPPRPPAWRPPWRHRISTIRLPRTTSSSSSCRPYTAALKTEKSPSLSPPPVRAKPLFPEQGPLVYSVTSDLTAAGTVSSSLAPLL